MGKGTGTGKGIQVWFRQQRWLEDSSLELHALALEGAQLVASWSLAEVREDAEEWSRLVDELATSDASARDQTTRYELRHVASDKPRGVMHLRRVVEPMNVEPSTTPTGDATSLIIQLQRSLERANAQVIESSRVATMTAQAAIASQQAALGMLSQAYALIGGLQTTQVEMHADRIEGQGATKERAGDKAFMSLLEVVGPMVVQKLMEDESGAKTPKEH